MLRLSKWLGFGLCAFVLACSLPALLASGCDDTTLDVGDPIIEVEPDALDFGTLNVGESRNLTLTVSNTGTASLKISGLDVDDDAEFVIETKDGQPFDMDEPIGLSQGSSMELSISFAPDERDVYAADLVIYSDAENEQQVRVPLFGSSSVPDIEVSPLRLDFGGVGLNSTLSLFLTVTNRGDAPLLVNKSSDLELASGNPDPFSLHGQDLNLASGEQRTIEVVYGPKDFELDANGDVIPDEDVLLIHSNDPDDYENPVLIDLSGHASGNLWPVTAISIAEITKLDGTPLADACAPAPSDTVLFQARVRDPEGGQIQSSNLLWEMKDRPANSISRPPERVDDMAEPPDLFYASFKVDLWGDYEVCVFASDAQGNIDEYDPAEVCDCPTANASQDYSCHCMRFTAIPREDIRIELTWDILGPDLDLHLVAPDGEFCTRSLDCSFNPWDFNDPNWTKTACVDSGAIMTCRPPDCDPVALGCLRCQECYDNACHWKKCSGSDCYWDGRHPDWGVLCDEVDDPAMPIDCTGGCREEKLYLNRPEQGIYTVMVNYFDSAGKPTTTATVKIFFKGDVNPTAEFTSYMTPDDPETPQKECDTWNVALITWTDPEDHPVIYLGDSHSSRCCD